MDLHSSDAGAFLLPWPHVGVKFTWPAAMHAHNMNTANNNRVRMAVMEVVETEFDKVWQLLFAVTVERFANGRADIVCGSGLRCLTRKIIGGFEVGVQFFQPRWMTRYNIIW